MLKSTDGRQCNVMVRNDCESAVMACSKLYSHHSPTLNALAQVLRTELRKYDTTFTCIHVPGKFKNRTELSLFRDTVYCADQLSRSNIDEMREIAARLAGGTDIQTNELRDNCRTEFSVDRLFFGEGVSNYDGLEEWEWMQTQFTSEFEPVVQWIEHEENGDGVETSDGKCEELEVEWGAGVEFVGDDLADRVRRLNLPADTRIRMGAVVDPALPNHLRCYPETMHAPGMSAVHSMRHVPGYRAVRGGGTSSADEINWPSPTRCCVYNVAVDSTMLAYRYRLPVV